MTIVADESVDQPIVNRLRVEGISVSAIAEESPGVTDETVLATAADAGAVLLTADKDFGNSSTGSGVRTAASF